MVDDIDYVKSRQKNRIVFTSWLDNFIEPIIFYSLCLFFCAMIILNIVFEADFSNINDYIISVYIFPVVGLFVAYLVYKKILSRRFRKITTIQTRESQRINIVKMATDFGWNIHYNNRNYLIADSDSDINGVGNQITILFEDNYILVNVIKKSFRGIRFPLLIEDWDTIKDIRKYITENAPQMRGV